MYPLIAFTLATIQETEAQNKANHINEFSDAKQEGFNFWTLAKIGRFTFGLISQVLVFTTITSLQPTLALHLESFGYTPVFIGFTFAVPTLIYASTTPLIYILTEKFKKTTVILFGYLLMAMGMFLVGTSKILGFYNSPAFIIIGLAVMGFGAGMIIIPILPDMLESIEENHPSID